MIEFKPVVTKKMKKLLDRMVDRKLAEIGYAKKKPMLLLIGKPM